MAGTGLDGQRQTFGALLRRYRAESGLSQSRLSVRAGISVDAIGMLERGIRTAPRGSTVSRLAGALRLRPHDREALVAAARPATRRADDVAMLLELARDLADSTQRLEALSRSLGAVCRELCELFGEAPTVLPSEAAEGVAPISEVR